MRQRYAADVTEADENGTEVWEYSDPTTGEIFQTQPSALLIPPVQPTRGLSRGGSVHNNTNRVTVREVTQVGGNDVINQDYFQQRLNCQHRDPSTTNPQRRPMGNGVKTIKSRRPVQEDEHTYHVDVQRKGQKSFSFYVKIIGSAIVVGALSWFFAIAPAIHHYHVGDSPVHQYTVVMNGEQCDATAYLNGPHTAIDIIFTVQNKKSKATSEALLLDYSGADSPEITLETRMDVNGDGKSDIIVLANGRQVGVLLANKTGTGFEWSKQA